MRHFWVNMRLGSTWAALGQHLGSIWQRGARELRHGARRQRPGLVNGPGR